MSGAAPSILAIHSGALGDVVLFGRLLEQLGAPVTLAAGREKADLLAWAGVAAKPLDFDSLPLHELFIPGQAPVTLREKLGCHDRLISCFGGGHGQAEEALRRLVGGAAHFLPIRPPADGPDHLVAIWQRQLGLPPLRRWPAWTPAADSRPLAQAALAEAGLDPAQPYAVLHAGAGAADKCWPLERFMELGRLLRPRMQVVFTLGPVEAERWDPSRIQSLRRDFAVLLAPELKTLAAVLAHCSRYVGNDSGVSHLAAAMGAATLALLGPTRAEHFAPLGPAVKTLSAARMEDISLQEAFAALRE